MNLFLRILTAVILLPIIISCFYFGGQFLLALLYVAAIGSSIELIQMIIPKKFTAKLISLFTSICIFSAYIFLEHQWIFWPALFGGLLFTCVFCLFAKEIDQAAFEKMGALYFFQSYALFGIASLWHLHLGHFTVQESEGLSFILLACLGTWSNDSMAYFGGRLWGKRPLFARISPKKTWEGFVIGAIGTLGLPFLLQACFSAFGIEIFRGLSSRDMAWVLVPIIVLAPVGDLLESKIKRLYGVKDSSNLLPGHGGILDRIDALLLVCPWTLAYAFLLRPM